MIIEMRSKEKLVELSFNHRVEINRGKFSISESEVNTSKLIHTSITDG